LDWAKHRLKKIIAAVVIRVYGLGVRVYGLANQNPITEPKVKGSYGLVRVGPETDRVRVKFGLGWFGSPVPRVYPDPCTPLTRMKR
jgi:hypothetical protein